MHHACSFCSPSLRTLSILAPLSLIIGVGLSTSRLPAQCSGGATFSAPQSKVTQTSLIRGIRAVDIDHDGDVDLVHGELHAVRMLRNDGGSFTPETLFATNLTVHDVLCGDFDADGGVDIAVLAVELGVIGGATSYRPLLRIHWRQPAGSPTAYGPYLELELDVARTTLTWLRLAAGDLDSDGVQDFAAVDGRGSLWVTRGGGEHGRPDRSLLPPEQYPTPHFFERDVALADLDHDGALDAVVLNGFVGQLSEVLVFPGQLSASGKPLGTFAAPLTIATGAGDNYDLEVHDLDHDGWHDLAIVKTHSHELHLLRGLGAMTFAAATVVPMIYPDDALAADFDLDGRDELLVPRTVSSLTGPNGTLVADPFGTPTLTDVQFGLGFPDIGVAEDLDGDGAVDAAVGTFTYRVKSVAGQCAPSTPPLLLLAYPGGSEQMVVDDVQTISWVKGPDVGSVDIDFSPDDGASWRTIAVGCTGTTFDWRVTPPSSNRCRIRLRAHGNSTITDTIAIPFTIGGPGYAAVTATVAGCGQPTSPALTATVPFLGGASEFAVTQAPASSLCALWVSWPGTTTISLGSGCATRLDPPSLLGLSATSTSASGACGFGVVIPSSPTLQGVTFAAQATLFTPASPLGFWLSNGVEATLGF